MTNSERTEMQKMTKYAYEKGFNAGFEYGWERAIDQMEKLIKREADKKKENENECV